MMKWPRLIMRFTLVGVSTVAVLIGLIVAATPLSSTAPALLTIGVQQDGALHIDQFDGRNQTRLVDGSSLPITQIDAMNRLSWSPDGTRLVFLGSTQPITVSLESAPIGQVQQIWMLDTRSNTAHPLTELSSRNPGYDWSADSRRLAYTDGSWMNIITPESPGTPPQTINLEAYGLTYATAHSPVWSPVDPDKLAMVVANRNQMGTIALIEPDHPEAEPRLLISDAYALFNLTWRYDGQALFYRRVRISSTELMVFQYDLLAEFEQRLDLRYLSWWSPDSRHVAISPERQQILITDTLGNTPDLLAALPKNHSLVTLAWSPDSRYIAYLAETSDGGCALYLVDVAFKTQQHILPDQQVQCYVDIAWQPPVDSD